MQLFFFCLPISSFGTHTRSQQTNNRCEAVLDLTLIVDSSGSVSTADFRLAKNAMIDLVNRLNIKDKMAGVNVINYASNVEMSAQSDVFDHNRDSVIQHIDNLKYIGSGTATGDALFTGRTFCARACRPLAQAVTRAVIVFTDGNSNQGRSVATEAKLFRDIEATMFAIGIGVPGAIGDVELLNIAGDPDNVLRVSNYLELTQIVNKITTYTCDFPAFVEPGTRIDAEVQPNGYRYYRMNTLKLRNGMGGFVDVTINNHIGRTRIFTSTTDKNPKIGTAKESSQTRGSNTYTTYVPSGTENFYFSIYGVDQVNQFDFETAIYSLDESMIG